MAKTEFEDKPTIKEIENLPLAINNAFKGACRFVLEQDRGFLSLTKAEEPDMSKLTGIMGEHTTPLTYAEISLRKGTPVSIRFKDNPFRRKYDLCLEPDRILQWKRVDGGYQSIGIYADGSPAVRIRNPISLGSNELLKEKGLPQLSFFGTYDKKGELCKCELSLFSNYEYLKEHRNPDSYKNREVTFLKMGSPDNTWWTPEEQTTKYIQTFSRLGIKFASPAIFTFTWRDRAYTEAELMIRNSKGDKREVKVTLPNNFDIQKQLTTASQGRLMSRLY